MGGSKGILRPEGKIKVISADNPSIVGDYALILLKIAFSVEVKTSKQQQQWQQQQQQKIISVEATLSATTHLPSHVRPLLTLLCPLMTLLKSCNSLKMKAGGSGRGAKVRM